MVKGRMPRESNPVPGEKPGFTNNFDTTGNGDFDTVSPLNRLPVKDPDVKLELANLRALIEANSSTSYPEYRILSSDPFPQAKPSEKGAQLIIMDTGDIYFNHGSNWVVF